jgi:hypothetical protein
MLKLKSIKEVGKERAGKALSRAYSVISDSVNGKRNASYIINLLCNNGFTPNQVKGYITEGIATERQYKAVERVIMGRHYIKRVFEGDFENFLNYPNDFNVVIPIKEAKIWVNITREEEKRVFTAEELAEFDKNF